MILKNIYNKENQTIDFQKDYVLIKIGNVYKKKILYTEISCLFFNMDKDGYYFRLQDKGAEQYHFDYKFNTRYRMINKKNLIEKVKNKKINLVPG